MLCLVFLTSILSPVVAFDPSLAVETDATSYQGICNEQALANLKEVAFEMAKESMRRNSGTKIKTIANGIHNQISDLSKNLDLVKDVKSIFDWSKFPGVYLKFKLFLVLQEVEEALKVNGPVNLGSKQLEDAIGTVNSGLINLLRLNSKILLNTQVSDDFLEVTIKQVIEYNQGSKPAGPINFAPFPKAICSALTAINDPNIFTKIKKQKLEFLKRFIIIFIGLDDINHIARSLCLVGDDEDAKQLMQPLTDIIKMPIKQDLDYDLKLDNSKDDIDNPNHNEYPESIDLNLINQNSSFFTSQKILYIVKNFYFLNKNWIAQITKMKNSNIVMEFYTAKVPMESTAQIKLKAIYFSHILYLYLGYVNKITKTSTFEEIKTAMIGFLSKTSCFKVLNAEKEDEKCDLLNRTIPVNKLVRYLPVMSTLLEFPDKGPEIDGIINQIFNDLPTTVDFAYIDMKHPFAAKMKEKYKSAPLNALTSAIENVSRNLLLKWYPIDADYLLTKKFYETELNTFLKDQLVEYKKSMPNAAKIEIKHFSDIEDIDIMHFYIYYKIITENKNSINYDYNFMRKIFRNTLREEIRDPDQASALKPSTGFKIFLKHILKNRVATITLEENYTYEAVTDLCYFYILPSIPNNEYDQAANTDSEFNTLIQNQMIKQGYNIHYIDRFKEENYWGIVWFKHVRGIFNFYEYKLEANSADFDDPSFLSTFKIIYQTIIDIRKTIKSPVSRPLVFLWEYFSSCILNKMFKGFECSSEENVGTSFYFVFFWLATVSDVKAKYKIFEKELEAKRILIPGIYEFYKFVAFQDNLALANLYSFCNGENLAICRGSALMEGIQAFLESYSNKGRTLHEFTFSSLKVLADNNNQFLRNYFVHAYRATMMIENLKSGKNFRLALLDLIELSKMKNSPIINHWGLIFSTEEATILKTYIQTPTIEKAIVNDYSRTLTDVIKSTETNVRQPKSTSVKVDARAVMCDNQKELSTTLRKDVFANAIFTFLVGSKNIPYLFGYSASMLTTGDPPLGGEKDLISASFDKLANFCKKPSMSSLPRTGSTGTDFGLVIPDVILETVTSNVQVREYVNPRAIGQSLQTNGAVGANTQMRGANQAMGRNGGRLFVV